MRKLALKMSITLDGFVGDFNGDMEWMRKSMDPGAAAWIVDQISKAGAHLAGRKTFEVMAGYWPTSTLGFAAPMNQIPKIAFSKKGFDPSVSAKGAETWARAEVLTGDLKAEVANLKNQDGKILVAHGGASFAQSLVRTGLIDEYWLVIHPVVLGRGLPLFSELEKPLHLKLVSSQSYPGGAMTNIYRPH